MNRGLLVFLATTILIVAISTLVILLAQGYRYNSKTKTIQNIGILSIAAEPKGASIKINGKLVGATDQSSFNLDPGDYDLEISKDGFSTWTKRVKVVREKVTAVEATIYPVVPNLSSPLTFTGIRNSQLSPDLRKILYTVKNGVKGGLWVLDMSEGFFQSKEPQQIASDRVDIKFSDAKGEWSNDANSVLVSIKQGSGRNEAAKNYLLDINTRNETLNEVGSDRVTELRETWKKDRETKQKNLINNLPVKGRELASGVQNPVFSPDETKFIALKGEEMVLYDSKPLFNPENPDQKETAVTMAPAKKHFWLPNGHNLIVIEDKTISVIDRDGSNKTVIYSGVFESETVFPNPSGNKLVFAATFNPAVRKEPDLYTLDLK